MILLSNAEAWRRSLERVSRIGARVLVLLIMVIVANFLLLHLLPGDAVDVINSDSSGLSAATLKALRHQQGLDLPLARQLLAYLGRVAHLDLGYSIRFHQPVIDLIAQRLPATLLLALPAMAIALALGTVLGALSALWAGGWVDRTVSVVVVGLYSLPGFWIGLMMIILFSAKLGWLPSGGARSIGFDDDLLGDLSDRLAHLVLPLTALALHYTAIYARVVRATMLDTLAQDYIRTAYAKGLSRMSVVRHHVLRNALVPVMAVGSIHVSGILGGTVVIEQVFGWPGIGRLAMEAVAGRDMAVLLGILVLSCMLVILANAVFDILHGLADPRVGDAQ